ncbi:GDSL-type esterase/lipase family protein [Pseudomonas subflava]|uniref:GDSL-type esterase/lipase family protein n=1 Tax=Pseudomonas subflava TaxID=2952933 RepID=UPI00207A1528
MRQDRHLTSTTDLRRRAGLLLWAFLLLFACWKALDLGRPAEPPSREQRVARDFASLRASDGRAALVMLGDSITAGRQWSAAPGCRPPLNLAVSGATTADLLRHLDLVERAGAAQALLMIGINDLRHGVPLDELLANYRVILGDLQRGGVTPVLQSTLRVTPMHRDHQAINRQVDALNGQLRAWAREQGWRFVEVQAVVGPRGYRGDGLHLNVAGYAAWQRLIDPLLCSGSDQPGQAQQPPGEDEHLHQQAGEA